MPLKFSPNQFDPVGCILCLFYTSVHPKQCYITWRSHLSYKQVGSKSPLIVSWSKLHGGSWDCPIQTICYQEQNVIVYLSDRCGLKDWLIPGVTITACIPSYTNRRNSSNNNLLLIAFFSYGLWMSICQYPVKWTALFVLSFHGHQTVTPNIKDTKKTEQIQNSHTVQKLQCWNTLKIQDCLHCNTGNLHFN